MHILEKIQKDRIQKFILIVSLVLFALGIYVMNILYPVYADDWVYTLFYEKTPHRALEGFVDLIISQYNHYVLWGGRTVAHTIAQLLLKLPPFVHDILNTLAFVAFVFMIYKISNIVYKKINGLLLLFVVCLLWIFTDPMIFSSAIWITGSANYLWTSLIILLFIYPFVTYLVSEENNGRQHKKWMNILMLVSGLIAGWTNENSAIALLFFLLAFFIICKKNKKPIPFWCFLATLGAFVGCVLLLMAPGNFARLDEEIVDGTMPQDRIDLIIYKLTDFIKTIKITYTLYLTVLYLLMLGLYIMLNKDWNSTKEKRNALHLSFLFMLTAYVAAAAMMAAPMISYRTLFFSNALLIIAMGLLFVDIYKKNSLTQCVGLFFIALLLVFSSYDYSKKYKTLHFISDLWVERDQYIEAEKAKGNRDIIFPTTFTAHPKFLLNEMKPDASDSRNRFYSIYKGVDSIRSDSAAVRLQTP